MSRCEVIITCMLPLILGTGLSSDSPHHSSFKVSLPCYLAELVKTCLPDRVTQELFFPFKDPVVSLYHCLQLPTALI